MKYISHRAVYTILPKILLELPDSVLDNYIIQCIRQIDAHPMYEKKLILTKAVNGVAELPKDFIKAYGVFYNNREPSDEEYESLLGCILEDENNSRCISDSPLTDTATNEIDGLSIEDIEPIAIQDRYKLIKLIETTSEGTTTKYIMKGITYDNYLNSAYHLNCWTPLFYNDKLFTQCFMEKKSPCSVSKCDFRYSFDKCGHILTSMPDGWLKIAYTGRPTDKDGNYMIPDNMDYLKVLKDGVLMLYWEERRTNNREGSVQNHRDYEIKFYNGVAGIRGSAMLPKGALKDKALRNIIYEKIAIANDYSLTGNGGWEGATLYKHMRR